MVDDRVYCRFCQSGLVLRPIIFLLPTPAFAVIAGWMISKDIVAVFPLQASKDASRGVLG